MLSDRNEKSEGFTKAEAGRVENMRFNRYRDVNPYDHSRVVLNGERAATDYINASLVKVRLLSPTGPSCDANAGQQELFFGQMHILIKRVTSFCVTAFAVHCLAELQDMTTQIRSNLFYDWV